MSKIAIHSIFLIKKFEFLQKSPVALHLKNTNFTKFVIVKEFKQRCWIQIIKNFNIYAYNGCRKKKVRRIKFKKKLKTRRNGREV